MGLFGLLLLSFGTFCAVVSTECLPETEKCSQYWEKILPHTNLISSEAELNSWCSKQARFYQCLEDVLLEGKNGNLSYLPTNLLISKLYSQDLCSDGSKSRIRLLSNADCINQLNTDFCILPEYLDIVMADDDIPSSRCSQAEKTFSCIAATMVLNCGFDAARVYRTMLKITRYSDEICGIEASEGIPPCEGSGSKPVSRDKKLSEMYYGLFHRIGSVLDPDDQDVEGESSKQTLEDESSPVSEKLEHAVEMATEAIKSAIDKLEEDLIFEELIVQEQSSTPDSISNCSKDVHDYKPYMKNPIITEVFKEFLFYNYSGKEFAVYWRQPLFTVTDGIHCEQLQPSYMKVQIFRCKIGYRYNDPDCVSNATVHEKVTPEFIRSFDPEIPCDSTVEFGPRPEFMLEIDQLYEERRIREQTPSTTLPPKVTKVPEGLTACSTLVHLAGTMCPKKEAREKKWYEYNFEENNMNAPFPNELYYEIKSLVFADLESFEPPPMHRIKIGDSMFFIMYDPDFAKPMENLTCSRMDECHPRAKGLWKCKIFPRQIQTCDTCGKYPTEDPLSDIQIYARPAKTREAGFTVLDTTEPAITDESVLQSSTPFIEPIRLSFSGGSSNSESEKAVNSELNKVGSMSDQEASEDSEMEVPDKLEYKLVPESDNGGVRYQIVNVFDGDDDTEPSQVVYEIQSDDTEDEESRIVLATEDGLLSGNIVFMENVPHLEETKYTVVSVPSIEAV